MTANLSQLFPALVECFIIILFGYLAGRMNLISSTQAQGIECYIKNFAFPALIFKNMVELNFATVSWIFIASVFIGKLIVFIIVLVLSLILVRPHSYARGALYSIFATQSNDFALGYPMIAALYQTSHPEYLQYIYLLAPISLLILNPIGFVLLEIDKSLTTRKALKQSEIENVLLTKENLNEENVDVLPDTTVPTWCKSIGNIVKGVLLNPIVLMVFVGLVFHFIFNGKIPLLLDNFLITLSAAFSATALFYLGLTMVGKIKGQGGIGLIISASLITAKIILLPIIIRAMLLYLGNVWPIKHDLVNNSTTYLNSLADFGYLYGTFPTAPTLVIYAAQYGMEMDRLATGMVFCTSISAPIMYVSAWTITMSSMTSSAFHKELIEINKDISIISIFCSIWCIVIFVLGRKCKRVPHFITFALIVSILFSSLATVFWSVFIRTNSSLTSKAILFAFMFYGMQASRLISASLALGLLISVKRNQSWVSQKCIYFIAIPNFVAAVATIFVVSFGQKNIKDATTPVFMFGKVEEYVSFAIILLSFIFTGLCLIVLAKSSYTSEPEEISATDTSERSSLLTESERNIHLPPESEREEEVATSGCASYCMFSQTHHGDIQKTRHIVLLLLLLLSMLIGMSVVTWKFSKMKQTGVFMELSFLDAVFSFGQAFLVFCVFGLDSELIIDPFVRACRKCFFGSEEISLKSLDSLDSQTVKRCYQFVKYHLEQCKADILQDTRRNFVLYEEVFTGEDMCNWLVDHGLVNDTNEAVGYGESLMEGRIIYNINQRHYFHNKNYIYKFSEKKVYVKTHQVQDYSHSQLSTSQNGNISQTVNYLSVTPQRFYGFSFEAYYSGSEYASKSYQSTPSTPVTKPAPRKVMARKQNAINNQHSTCWSTDSE